MSSVQAEWTRAVSLATLGVWQGAREASSLLSLQQWEVSGRRHGQVSEADVCTLHYPFAHLRARGQGEPVEQSGEASNSERNIFIPTCVLPSTAFHTRHVRTARRPSAGTEQPGFLHPAALWPRLLWCLRAVRASRARSR